MPVHVAAQGAADELGRGHAGVGVDARELDADACGGVGVGGKRRKDEGNVIMYLVRLKMLLSNERLLNKPFRNINTHIYDVSICNNIKQL